MEMEAINGDDVRRVAKSFFDIAVFEDTVPNFVGAGGGVKNGLVFQRFFGVHHHGKRLVINLDEFSGICGSGAAGGNHRCDRFALIAGASDRQGVIQNF